MTKDAAKLIIDKTWMAVKKGDKQAARAYLNRLGYELLMRGKLKREDRFRLGWALMKYEGDAVAVFGFLRRGPSSTKTTKKLVVWAEVKIEKDKLRRAGENQTEVYENVANNLGSTYRMVEKDYEEVQKYIKEHEAEYELFNTGIAALIK